MRCQPERAAALDKLATVKKQIADLQTELNAYGACDPAKVDEKKRAVTLAKEAAFRWTGKSVDPFASMCLVWQY